MHGLWGVKTANDDKDSDPTDLQFICFDISHKAVVYILYDTRATGASDLTMRSHIIRNKRAIFRPI